MEDIGLPQLLSQYITNAKNQLFTAMPARVVSVQDLAEQRVDVQLLVDRVTPEDTTNPHPVVLNVPLMFPGSKSAMFSFPVDVGDTVLCVFSQRSIERFKLGAETNHRPSRLSKYSRDDAIAIPGLYSFPSARNNPDQRNLSHDTADTVVTGNIGTSSECEVRFKRTGDVIINSPSKVEVNCSTADINASSEVTIDSPQTTVTGQMLVNGLFPYTAGMVGSGGSGATADITGDVVADGVSLKNHTHSQPSDSAGDTEAETNPPS